MHLPIVDPKRVFSGRLYEPYRKAEDFTRIYPMKEEENSQFPQNNGAVAPTYLKVIAFSFTCVSTHERTHVSLL